MVGTQQRDEKRTRTSDAEPRPPVLGEVTKVRARDTDSPGSPEEQSNHEANVRLLNREEEPRFLPIIQNFSGSIGVPKKGDIVFVEYTRGITEKPMITGYAYTQDANPAPLGREGHWRHEFGDLYIEAERTDHAAIDDSNPYDIVRLAKKADGLSDPTAQVEIDDSGSDPVIRVSRSDANGDTDMGIVLDFGTGEFKIGDGAGYGIVSDGSGNFTWYENSVNWVDDGTTITW